MVMASAVLTAVNWSPKAYPEGWALIKLSDITICYTMADLYLPKDEIRENRAEKPLQRLLDPSPYTRGSCLIHFWVLFV